jgi:hypothetical protein
MPLFARWNTTRGPVPKRLPAMSLNTIQPVADAEPSCSDLRVQRSEVRKLDDLEARPYGRIVDRL